MPVAESFSERLVSALDNSSISRAELARRLEVSPNTVSNWTTGKFQPSAELIGPLADALGVAPGALLGAAVSSPLDELQALVARIAALEPQVKAIADATPDLLELLADARRAIEAGGAETGHPGAGRSDRESR